MTKTLRNLSELLPERFIHEEITLRSDEHRVVEKFSVLLGGGIWQVGDDMPATSNALIQAACQEEIEAKGWKWIMESYLGGTLFDATILTGGGIKARQIGHHGANSAALAIATALLDAIKAEKP